MSTQVSYLVALAQEALADEDRWFGDTGTQRSLAFHTLALGGDVGLLTKLVQQLDLGNKDPRDPSVRYELVERVCEAFHDLLVICGLLGLDLEKALPHWRGTENNRMMLQRVGRESKRNGN